jgi:hypothetical protein
MMTSADIFQLLTSGSKLERDKGVSQVLRS